MEINREEWSVERLRDSRLLTFALILIIAALTIHLLVFASSVLIPILFGFYLSVLVYSPMMLLRRLFLPKAIAALIPVLIVFAGIIAAVLLLHKPIMAKVDAVPAVIDRIQTQIAPVREAINQVNDKTEEVEAVIDDALNKQGKTANTIVVDQGKQRWRDIVLEELSHSIWFISVTLLLCYFFLVGGDALARNIALTFRHRSKQIAFLQLVRKVRASLARYIMVTMCVNLAYGMSIALMLLVFGVEYAFVWGVLVGLSRYIPYIGNLLSLVMVTIAVADSHVHASTILLAPAITALIMFITGNFIDPIVHSRQFHLNPIFLFISIIFWGWLWGVAGVFIAIPTLLMFTIVAGQLRSLQRLYVILCLNMDYKRVAAMGS